MKLQAKFLAFCKPHLDRWMLAFQRDAGVGLDEWKELQADYKSIYGKEFERASR